MKLACWFIFFSLFYCSFSFCCTVKDDIGVDVNLKQPAKRIISLAPDITETLFAIGAGESLVGVIDGSDFPERAKHIPRIGSYAGLDLERIISLKPDLIITWGGTFKQQLSVLKKLGVPIYVSDSHHLQDVALTMRNLGCLTGVSKLADKVSQQFINELVGLEKHFAKQKRLSVFYQIGPYELFTVNQDSWINQVITLCGGTNIFSDAKVVAPLVSIESVIVANPDVIITSTLEISDTAHARAASPIWKKRWDQWQHLKAVKHQCLYSINPDLIERAGPRLLMGAMKMCKDLTTCAARA